MWSKLKAIWAFINGNKTKIGGLITIVGKVASFAGHPDIGNPIQAIGTAVTSVGLAHATAKVVSGEPQTPVPPAAQ